MRLEKVSTLEGSEWKIEFSWVKVHVGIYGNEIADRLAKEAARSKDTETAFSRNQISTLYYELEARQLQKEWENLQRQQQQKSTSPPSRRATNENKRYPQNSGDGDRVWEIQVLPPSIQTTRQRNMCLETRRLDH